VAGARRSERDDAFLVTKEVTVTTDPALPLDVDGEVRSGTPFTVGVAERALRVVVPAPRRAGGMLGR
jgi:diacylglycerol kinase family enzyme